jgi:hypothetical protein
MALACCRLCAGLNKMPALVNRRQQGSNPGGRHVCCTVLAPSVSNAQCQYARGTPVQVDAGELGGTKGDKLAINKYS